jgi:hypothetical protein
VSDQIHELVYQLAFYSDLETNEQPRVYRRASQRPIHNLYPQSHQVHRPWLFQTVQANHQTVKRFEIRLQTQESGLKHESLFPHRLLLVVFPNPRDLIPVENVAVQARQRVQNNRLIKFKAAERNDLQTDQKPKLVLLRNNKQADQTSILP